jgi:sec-independent protein translocase protein TatC
MRFILAFGISFLLPVLMLLLNRAGIVSKDQAKKARKYVIVGIFIVAAIATPPDVVSQLLLAFPLLALYEISLWLMWPIKRDAEADVEAETASEEVPTTPA